MCGITHKSNTHLLAMFWLGFSIFFAATFSAALCVDEKEIGSFAIGDSFWKFKSAKYYPLQDLQNAILAAATQHTAKVQAWTIGKSHENNKIYLLKVKSTRKGFSSPPAVFVECGIHGREWMAPASCMHLLHQLVTNPHEKDVRGLLEYGDVYIVPMLNPDGYNYTWTTDRLWRKNRAPNGCRDNDKRCCRGVDLNRNFDFHWAEVGASNKSCHELFAGTAPMSEPEILALQNAIFQIRHSIKLYISVHSFGQLVSVPWGYTNLERPDNFEDLKYVARMGAQAMSERYDIVWKYTLINSYYPAPKSGVSVDWAMAKLQIPFAFVFEMRPAGVYTIKGFSHYSYEIPDSGNELLAGLRAMVQTIGEL